MNHPLKYEGLRLTIPRLPLTYSGARQVVDGVAPVRHRVAEGGELASLGLSGAQHVGHVSQGAHHLPTLRRVQARKLQTGEEGITRLLNNLPTAWFYTRLYGDDKPFELTVKSILFTNYR